MEVGGQRVQVAEEDRLPLPNVFLLPKGNFREPRRNHVSQKAQLSWRTSSKASRSTGKFHSAGWRLPLQTFVT